MWVWKIYVQALQKKTTIQSYRVLRSFMGCDKSQ